MGIGLGPALESKSVEPSVVHKIWTLLDDGSVKITYRTPGGGLTTLMFELDGSFTD